MATFLRSWFGDFSKDELKKFVFLGIIFFFTIGIYWFLRTSKDGIFETLVSFEWQPYAKWVSMAFVIPLTAFYGFLVDRFPKHRVFYALSGIYAVGALIFSYLLAHPVWGIANAVPSPMRLLGWSFYLYVESFGSIMVMLFWTFATDTTSPESAKKGFPVLAFFAQCGALLGSAVTAGKFGNFSVVHSVLICAFAISMIGVLIFIFEQVIPQSQLKSYGGEQTKKKRAGVIESAKMVFSQPYLLGVFFSIVIYETINTLFDFKFKILVSDEVRNYVAANDIPAELVGEIKTQMFNSWTGWMGYWMAIVGIIALACGIGSISRRLGLTASLVIMPLFVGIVALASGFTHTALIAGIAALTVKAFNYAFYQPSKEELYIPTSKEARYKSKAFLEMFGSRGSKAFGSLVNSVRAISPAIFPMISLGSIVGLCVVWLMLSLYVGRTNKKAIARNEVVC